jgi:threonine synthase
MKHAKASEAPVPTHRHRSVATPRAGLGAWERRCAQCDRVHPPEHADYCRDCGAPVLAEPTQPVAAPLQGEGNGIWRYADHLPISRTWAWLGLGEGTATMVRADDIAARAGVREVWLAVDCLGPTGSFKDRAAAAGVAHALEHGAGGVVCASSGNAAASTAAYAARAGLPAVVVVPDGTPPAKVAAARAFGARVIRTAGDYSHSFALARELCAELSYANLATTYVNPTGVAALRTVAFELVSRLGPSAVDRVVVPTGAGALVHGVAAGFRYLTERQEAAHVPRVDAVQPAGCAPIVRAFEHGEDAVRPWCDLTTAISGLNDPLRGYPQDGTVTLAEVRRTGGVALSVADAATFAAQEELATRHGILVEPAAATSLAALYGSAAQAAYSAGDRIVCLLTGHGLKTLSTETNGVAPVPLVHTLEEAVAVVDRPELDAST